MIVAALWCASSSSCLCVYCHCHSYCTVATAVAMVAAEEQRRRWRGWGARCAQVTGRLLAWYVFTPLETAHGNMGLAPVLWAETRSQRPTLVIPEAIERSQQWSPCLQRDVMVRRVLAHGFAGRW